jgi:AcrR family transcriptional regulator
MKKTESAKRTPRRNDPEGTKQNILQIATEEFVSNGLAGARVDAIAKRMRTSKRMIYYYFGSKEELYRAVLEKAYADIRESEEGHEFNKLKPVDAMRRLIEVTFDFDETHPNFVRLVSIENLHGAEYLKSVTSIQGRNAVVLNTVSDILARGRKEGVFRDDVEAIDVHLLISAQCYFRVSNRNTFNTVFQIDLASPKMRAKHKRLICDAVIRMLAK